MILEKRLTTVDNISLQNSLHIQEFYNPTNINSKNYKGVVGNILSFTKVEEIETRTVFSFKSGWVTKQEKDNIITLYNDITKVFNLVYTDNSIEQVRFNHEYGLKFKPLFEGSEYYTIDCQFFIV